MKTLQTAVKQLSQLSQRSKSESVLKMIKVSAKVLCEMTQQAYEEKSITREQFYEYMDYVDEAEYYARK